MKKYKAMFIIKPELGEEQTKKVLETIKDIFASRGSKQIKVEEWGTRSLAYEIDDFTKGYYVLMMLEASSEAVSEYTRICNINENIIRHIIVSE